MCKYNNTECKGIHTKGLCKVHYLREYRAKKKSVNTFKSNDPWTQINHLGKFWEGTNPTDQMKMWENIPVLASVLEHCSTKRRGYSETA